MSDSDHAGLCMSDSDQGYAWEARFWPGLYMSDSDQGYAWEARFIPYTLKELFDN